MKRLFNIIIAMALTGMVIPSCDIVEEPYLVKVKSDDGTGPEEKIRKTILEEFTAQQCVNCPGAAAEAQNLKAIYGERLILVSIHAGPLSVPDADFPNDFRTPEGNELNNYFAPPGYPIGMVDRVSYGGSVLMLKDSWGYAIEALDTLDAQAWLTIDNNYNTANRKLECAIETEFLEDLPGTYNICVFLLESGIVSPQMTLQGTNPNYVHNHVLRTTLNGTWGDPVGTDGHASSEVSVSDNYTYNIPEAWNADNCVIIAFVYNTETLEIVQAEEAPL